MPNLPISQLPLAVSGQPESWMAIVNYDVDPSGITNKIYFSSLTEQFSGSTGTSGTSGTSGIDGTSGTSGIDGTSGTSGSSGTSGIDGTSGTSGSSGTSGIDGTSGTSGIDGTSGTSGTSGVDGTSGTSGSSGTSGTSGIDGTSGTSGIDGTSGTSGIDGTSGTSGSSGTSGIDGTSGTSGSSGTSGTSAPTPPFALVYGLFAQTADSTTISATTVETSLINGGVGTLSVPANGFSVGDSFRADFGGIITAANNQTIDLRVKTGSVVLADSLAQPITNITNNVWSLSINFTIRATGTTGVASIVTLGTFNYTKTVNGTIEGFSFNTVNNTTFDTTVSNTLDVTLQWGSANAGNLVYSDIFVLNKIY